MNDVNRDELLRKIAINAGAVTCGIGYIFFFFFNSETQSLTLIQKSFATLTAFIVSYVGIFYFFKNKKF